MQLGSKDVIHSFFLPNYRVKLDAVPGMRGKICFTATMTSKEREKLSLRPYKIEELEAVFARPMPPEMNIVIDASSKGAIEDPRKKGTYLYVEDPKATKPKTIIRGTPGFNGLSKENIAKLKTAGVTDITAYEPGAWDLVCEELCGQGHYTMQGRVVVLDSKEYADKYEGGRSLNPPTSQPSNIASAAP